MSPDKSDYYVKWISCEGALASVRTELEGERFCHRKDNEYLLGVAKDLVAAIRAIDVAAGRPEERSSEREVRLYEAIDDLREVLARYPDYLSTSLGEKSVMTGGTCRE